ncbi:hypothetical protein BV22DRAFT_666909 [Leucogyrophana mollusca]|uniref:Uncharacterized protein n=1 Tax=Leucogyrophana mollusca TaxID=85980 RepID=A0ACB8BAH8_9AGAM|nr:hypothetical protein BV22DRAFT_666909 [Leucogyrophana mollusca]
MASWVDLFSLLTTTLFFVGAIVGVIYIAKQITAAVQSTKQTLQERGIAISDKGVSVKTSKRFDRSDYVDATQRGFIKAMNSASYGSGDAEEKHHPKLKSASSVNGASHEAKEHEKKKVFGMRRTHSSTSSGTK